MSKKAFDKIAEALHEVASIVRDEAAPAKLYVPPEIDVRSIRRRTGLPQDGFASTFGFTINQVRDWEQGRARPLGGVRAYLMAIATDPETVQAILRRAEQRVA